MISIREINIKKINGLGKRRVVDSNELAQAIEEAFPQNSQSNSQKYKDSARGASSSKISPQGKSGPSRKGMGGRKVMYPTGNIHLALAMIAEGKTFEWISAPINL